MSTVTHVISVPLLPPDAMTALKLRAALGEMCAADPTLSVAIGPANEIDLQGFSELQLEFAIDILKRSKGLVLQVGAPQVRYLETITRIIEWEYTHARPTGEYAKVKIRFAPGEPGSGFVFVNAVRHDAVPERFVPAIEKALASTEGVAAKLPLTDIRCTLIDGAFHEVDSTERTFDIAARTCLREALSKAGPWVLEPVMKVAVSTPEDYMGDVIGDLISRRGRVTGMEARDGMQEITAYVPLANMFGYTSTLWSMTRRMAQSAMTFARYEPIPPNTPDDDNFPPAVGMRA
jgi:elongation factor G